ncbi:hypothetical protein EW145_g6901 [Phellinidium pouzarii]|uniref:F-box domain-containing protein n=1 Tax=Phellinidium pouzarii TaxID=167371 RepID=A0A4S4KS94_9AGAM|nr:hypothetical protein EW145_g6901 [Phellinidium pouzarii]
MSEPGDKIDLDTINVLIAFLSRLKNSDGDLGGNAIGDLWASSLEDSSAFTETTELSRSRHALFQITKCRDTLNAIATSANNRLPVLRLEYNESIFRRGFSLLTDDLVEHVFETLHLLDGDVDNRCSLKLSHVCRRFRSIALRLPTLWMNVTSHDDIDELQTYLSRSKDVGLRVILACAFGGTECKCSKGFDSFLRTIVPHASRWKEFQIEAAPHQLWVYLPQLRLHCYELQLPLLDTLVLAHSESSISDLTTDFDEDLLHFYRTWSMPNLRHLKAYDFLPHVFMLHSNPFPQTLTFCSFTLDNSDTELPRLMSFLAQQPSLHSLTIVMGAALLSNEPLINTVKLAHLESLDVHINLDLFPVPDTSFTRLLVMQFFFCLDTPRLSKISINLEGCDADVGEWLECIFPRLPSDNDPDPYAALREISFSMRTRLDKKEKTDLLFKKFKNLEHLSISAPDVPLHIFFPTPDFYSGRYCYTELPPLRSIHLTPGSPGDARVIEQFLKALGNSPGETKRGKLWVTKKPQLKDSHPDSIHWYAEDDLEWKIGKDWDDQGWIEESGFFTEPVNYRWQILVDYE